MGAEYRESKRDCAIPQRYYHSRLEGTRKTAEPGVRASYVKRVSWQELLPSVIDGAT